MTDLQLKLLDDTYKNYLSGKNIWQHLFSEYSSDENNHIRNSIDFLVEKGFLKVALKTLGYDQYKITVSGIEYVENGYHEPNTHTISQGNNSICVMGSNNTITDNYCNITLDINNSDLPDDIKILICTLVSEMKDPNLSKESKLGKVKNFISSMTSDTLSGVASSGLVALLTSLFTHV